MIVKPALLKFTRPLVDTNGDPITPAELSYHLEVVGVIDLPSVPVTLIAGNQYSTPLAANLPSVVGTYTVNLSAVTQGGESSVSSIQVDVTEATTFPPNPPTDLLAE